MVHCKSYQSWLSNFYKSLKALWGSSTVYSQIQRSIQRSSSVTTRQGYSGCGNNTSGIHIVFLVTTT